MQSELAAIKQAGDFRFTGGARFDPSERNLYFLASNVVCLDLGAAKRHDFMLLALNEIHTPEHLNTIEQWTGPQGVRLLLDSGVFNLARTFADARGIPLNEAFGASPGEVEGFEPLFDKYVATVKRLEGGLWGYIEIDMGGAAGKTQTRNRLESMGLRPIPVYHPFNDPPEYFDELARCYDRICIGNLVKSSSATRKRLMATLWERARAYPHLWIHLLGLTPNPWFNAYPFASSDSSGWLMGLRWTDSDRERAALQNCGVMGRAFAYQRGTPIEGPVGHTKATQLAAYRAAMNLRNWRNHLSAIDQLSLS